MGIHCAASDHITGKSDPCLELTLGPQTARTSVAFNTTDPLWGETFEFRLRGDVLTVQMWDIDYGTGREPMGQGTCLSSAWIAVPTPTRSNFMSSKMISKLRCDHTIA